MWPQPPIAMVFGADGAEASWLKAGNPVFR